MTSDLDVLCGFIREKLGHQGELDPTADLLRLEILDSFNIVEMAMFIQQTFGIELQGEDITRDNFARLADMVALIERRRADG